MTQARELKKRTVETSESGNVQVHQPEESHWEHSFLQLQRRAGNHAVVNLLATQGLVQRKCSTCTGTTKCTACEEEERTVQRKQKNVSVFSSTSPQIQRAPASQDAAEPTPAEAVGPLIVEDDAASVEPGQMRKSEFLEQLRSTVCSTADEALKEVGQSTAGCPYIEQWLSYYAEQTPSHIERALRKFAPEANTATSAHDYIPAISNRVRQAVQTWSQTGEVPDELAGMLSGGMLGGGILGGIGSAIGGAISAIGSAVGNAFSALFKAKEGQEVAADDPQTIQAQLTSGQPLNATVGARMGEAFGHDFSHVRVHTDASATGLSEQLNARAFTIGSDIAFGAGEYQPGTLIGDALIAHELAHVVQQHAGDVASSSAPQSKNDGDNYSLEEEADAAAVNAVVSTWGGAKSALTDIGSNAIPRLRSGLRLQSCSKPPQITVPRGQWITPEQSDQLLADDKLIGPRIKDRVAKGTKAVGHTTELETLDFLQKATDIEGEDAKIEKTSREMIMTGGFMYGGEIYLHRKTSDDYLSVTRHGKTEPIFAPPSAQPSTIVHETIHLYGTEAWREQAGQWADEGTTEYFTRRILSKQENKEGGGAGMFERISYPEEFEAVKCLADKANDELLADAYFLGQVEPLRKDVGEKEFDDWVAAMKAKDYPKAHTALGCKPPTKKPEE